MLYSKTCGIIGGGQLGRMMAYKASLLGFKTLCYTDFFPSPATVFCDDYVEGSYNDTQKIIEFSKKCDFITIEFENINIESLKAIENLNLNNLRPNANAISIAQNRLKEKEFIVSLGFETAPFLKINHQNYAELESFIAKHKRVIIKTSQFGYDGKGQFIVNHTEKMPQFNLDTEYIAEGFVDFDYELSCILVRDSMGKSYAFPTPINSHKNGILHTSTLNNPSSNAEAIHISQQIANKLNYIGVMAIEFFITSSGKIIINEFAPRPHNSGHFSQDLCNVCQFENHIRAVCDLPIIEPRLLRTGQMINLLGQEAPVLYNKHINNPNAKIHLYSKDKISQGRKLGHINLIGDIEIN